MDWKRLRLRGNGQDFQYGQHGGQRKHDVSEKCKLREVGSRSFQLFLALLINLDYTIKHSQRCVSYQTSPVRHSVKKKLVA